MGRALRALSRDRREGDRDPASLLITRKPGASAFVGLVGIASVRESRPPQNHSRLNSPGRVKGLCVKSPRTVLILPGVSLATTVVLQVGDSPGLPAHRGLHSCSGRLPQLALAIALLLSVVFLSQRMMCQDTQVAEGVEPVSGTH